MKKQFSFSNIKLKDLRQIVSIAPKFEEGVFDKWFQFPYTIHKEEVEFLKKIKTDRRLSLNGFSAEELKIPEFFTNRPYLTAREKLITVLSTNRLYLTAQVHQIRVTPDG